MRTLSDQETTFILGGMSHRTEQCLEYGAIGATEGALIGALIAFPFYALLAHPFFISSSARVMGLLLISSAISAGLLIGGTLGTATGYIAD